MAMQIEVDDSEIASYLASDFDNFAHVIWILTDWYRSYQMVGSLEGQESYQYVARQFGKWLAENANEYDKHTAQVNFCVEVVKSYKENIKNVK